MSTACNCNPVYHPPRPAPPPPPPPQHGHKHGHIVSCVKPVVGGLTDEEREKLEGIEENANNYILPPADGDTLGGIIVGDGLVAEEDGTLSIDVETVFVFDGGGAGGL